MKRRLGLGVDENVLATIGTNIATTVAGIDAEPRIIAEISPEQVRARIRILGVSVSNPVGI